MRPHTDMDGYEKIDQYNPHLVQRIADKYRGILDDLGMDVGREGLERTPERVAVVIEAQHLCMVMRGIQKQHSIATTSAFTGAFEQERTRAEFIRLVATVNKAGG